MIEVYYPTLTMKVTFLVRKMKMFSQDVTKMSLNTQNLNDYTKLNLNASPETFDTKNNLFVLNFINTKKNKYVNTTMKCLHLASTFTALMMSSNV